MLYHNNLYELNGLKLSARKYGAEMKGIKYPASLRYGQIAELGVAAMLGRLQTEIRKQKQRFYIECSVALDKRGIDFLINDRTVSLVSGFTYNIFYDMAIDDVQLFYDESGLSNLQRILESIGYEFDIVNDDKLKADLNALWEFYVGQIKEIGRG